MKKKPVICRPVGRICTVADRTSWLLHRFETPYGREAMSACNPEAVLTCKEMKHEEEMRDREMGG